MTKRPWVIHPFFLAAFPTVYLYSRNLKTVEFSDVLWPVGIALLASAVAYACLRAIRLDAPRTGLILSTFLVLFFSFSHGVKLCGRLEVGRNRLQRERIVLAAETAALALAVAFLLRAPGFARTVNDGCNVSALALGVMTLGGIVTSNSGPVPPETRSRLVANPEPLSPVATANGRAPDVYFLVLDAYGRSDVLRELYGFDNSGFLDRLERRGFVVARSSRSNYCQTALSLAATLGLRYLDDLSGDPSDDRRPLRRRIADNPTFRAFRDRGYRLVTFASGFDATESLDVDLVLAPPGNLRSFHALIADQTPLWLLLGQRFWRDPHRLHRERALKVFEELPAVAHPSDRPTFTFAHIVAPHPPFVFKADGRNASMGEPVYSLADSEGWRNLSGHHGPDDYARRYREQVAFITDRVEAVVDRILATSSTPPIILIQGDHGPGSRFDSSANQPNDIVERFGILNACLIPKPSRSRISPALTPINTLRVVLDACLGTRLGPLEDRSYYSSYAKPYLFTEVTHQLP